MVYLLPSVIRKIRERHSPVTVLLLIFGILLTGCKYIQPSRQDLAGESLSLLNDAIRIKIAIELCNTNGISDVYLYYNTEINCAKGNSEWKGNATVFWNNGYFFQECKSMVSQTATSCKRWRGNWVSSDTEDPVACIQSWLADISTGQGYYSKKPINPADYDDSLNCIAGSTYCVRLKNKPIQWKALCDAHPDSYFGGEALLQDFCVADISLFFDEESHQLRAVFITTPDQPWLEATMLIEASDKELSFDISEFEISEGVLSEEWNLLQKGS